MKKQKINLLIGDNTKLCNNTAYQLTAAGWDVACTDRNPLEIQMKAVSERFDAVVIFSDTNYSQTLCNTIKKQLPDCLIISVGTECGADISLRPPLNSAALYNTIAGRFELESPIDVVQNAEEINLHNKITKIIMGLCITPRYNGYNFIREAIKIAVSRDNNSIGISKHIYPEIAKRCSTSASAVERGMRTAIRRGWSKCGAAAKANLFGSYAAYSDFIPTNSEFIFVIADKINCSAQTNTSSKAI